MAQKILIVAAHPDDEVLGVGGTILKHTQNGDQVSVLILGDGVTSRGGSSEEIDHRIDQAKKVAKILGVKKIILTSLPDNKFDFIPLLSIAKKVEKIIDMIKPDIIYTHHGGDLNVDHRLTFQAVLTACRPQPNFCVKKILTFETPSSTEWSAKSIGESFVPNCYNDITDFIDKKIEALEIYENEMRTFPHPRSYEGVEILAKFRGMTVGHKFAEAFEIIRELNE